MSAVLSHAARAKRARQIVRNVLAGASVEAEAARHGMTTRRVHQILQSAGAARPQGRPKLPEPFMHKPIWRTGYASILNDW